MDLDDVPPESGVGIVAALAAGLLLSPRVRGFLRRSAVTVVAGALAAGDTVTAWARQLEGGGQPGEAGDTTFMRDLAQEARGELAARRQEAKQ